MIKQKTILEVNSNNRVYSLECSPDSPLGELFDALSQMKSFIIEKMKETEQDIEVKKDV